MRIGMRIVVGLLGVFALLLGAGALTPVHAAGAAQSFGNVTCSGATIAPGTYASLTITGNCAIPSGTVNVRGNMTVKPDAGLDASSANQALIVGGNLLVQRGASLVLGCSQGSGCSSNTNDRVNGNVIATQPLNMILHGDTIRGNFIQQGGGGGVTCPPEGSPVPPVFGTVEDSAIGGNAVVSGYHSCWYGFIRTHVAGNVILTNNILADPDAMEVVTNTIAGNLICFGNSPTPQTGDSGGQPNVVQGQKIGQCAHIQ